MRDLVRARAAAVETLRVHRQQVSSFMLRTWSPVCPRKTSVGPEAIFVGFKNRSLNIWLTRILLQEAG